MAFFEWKEEYSVGIHRIDIQHIEIIRLMNELFEAIRKGKQDVIIRTTFIELLKYANYHFGLELKLFEKYRYKNEKRHIEEHRYFIDKVKELMDHEPVEGTTVALDTLHFLRSWFEQHMMAIDIEYCRYFSHMKLMDEIDLFLKSEDDGYYIRPREI